MQRRGRQRKIKAIEKTYPLHRQSLQTFEREYLLGRFAFFDKIIRCLHPEDPVDKQAFHRFYKGEKLDILCLNTALTCYGEEKERDLFIDINSINEMTKEAEKKPLIVLAHHGLRFLTESEEDCLMQILKDRPVIYLCGHSHKLEHSFNEGETMWQIMIGATKYAEDLVPSFSVGEMSGTGEILQLDFYKYDFKIQRNWSLHKRCQYQDNSGKLHFTSLKPDNNEALIQLPLMPTTASSEDQRRAAIKTLSEIRRRLSRPGELQKYIVTSVSLPVNAGILIGYALHERQNVRLIFQNDSIIYANVKDENKIHFEEIKGNGVVSTASVVNLCVYIQAKSRDDGAAAFHSFIDGTRMKNVCIYSFVNRDTYDVNTNLEYSAREIANRITEVYEECKRNGAISIKLHLFFNGFWGLALLLGNQLPTIYPIQLYDYEASNQSYRKSFLLEPRMFNLVK